MEEKLFTENLMSMVFLPKVKQILKINSYSEYHFSRSFQASTICPVFSLVIFLIISLSAFLSGWNLWSFLWYWDFAWSKFISSVISRRKQAFWMSGGAYFISFFELDTIRSEELLLRCILLCTLFELKLLVSSVFCWFCH